MLLVRRCLEGGAEGASAQGIRDVKGLSPPVPFIDTPVAGFHSVSPSQFPAGFLRDEASTLTFCLCYGKELFTPSELVGLSKMGPCELPSSVLLTVEVKR